MVKFRLVSHFLVFLHGRETIHMVLNTRTAAQELMLQKKIYNIAN